MGLPCNHLNLSLFGTGLKTSLHPLGEFCQHCRIFQAAFPTPAHKSLSFLSFLSIHKTREISRWGQTQAVFVPSSCCCDVTGSCLGRSQEDRGQSPSLGPGCGHERRLNIPQMPQWIPRVMSFLVGWVGGALALDHPSQPCQANLPCCPHWLQTDLASLSVSHRACGEGK